MRTLFNPGDSLAVWAHRESFRLLFHDLRAAPPDCSLPTRLQTRACLRLQYETAEECGLCFWNGSSMGSSLFSVEPTLPDYKVLITLIYSEHQREAFGEAMALDIHDGSFEGEAAFGTFSSSNPFKGNICQRRPKTLLPILLPPTSTQRHRTNFQT